LTDFKKSIAFQTEWLMNLKIKTNVSHIFNEYFF
jgi:hypothetical protein